MAVKVEDVVSELYSSFYCEIDVHAWKHWSQPVRVAEVMCQQRECRSCGKVEIEQVYGSVISEAELDLLNRGNE